MPSYLKTLFVILAFGTLSAQARSESDTEYQANAETYGLGSYGPLNSSGDFDAAQDGEDDFSASSETSGDLQGAQTCDACKNACEETRKKCRANACMHVRPPCNPSSCDTDANTCKSGCKPPKCFD